MRKYIGLLTALFVVSASAAIAGDAAQPQGKGKKSWDPLRSMDTNNDGNVSKQEFMAASESRFNKLDANNDGTISKQERDMFANKRKARKGKGGDVTFP